MSPYILLHHFHFLLSWIEEHLYEIPSSFSQQPNLWFIPNSSAKPSRNLTASFNCHHHHHYHHHHRNSREPKHLLLYHSKVLYRQSTLSNHFERRWATNSLIISSFRHDNKLLKKREREREGEWGRSGSPKKKKILSYTYKARARMVLIFLNSCSEQPKNKIKR